MLAANNDRLALGELGDRCVVEAEMGLDELRRSQSEPLRRDPISIMSGRRGNRVLTLLREISSKMSVRKISRNLRVVLPVFST